MKAHPVQSAEYLGAFVSHDKMPMQDHPEHAFAGRSNVGKSSLINMLSGRRSLARVSSAPGKTECIHLYLINREWALADLPGYGYAKRSLQQRSEWKRFTWDYFTQRKNLACVFALADARIPPQESDIGFINRLGEAGVPFAIVFTKAEKAGKAAAGRQVGYFFEKLSDRWEEMPPHFITSAKTGMGREELMDFIRKTNERWKSGL